MNGPVTCTDSKLTDYVGLNRPGRSLCIDIAHVQTCDGGILLVPVFFQAVLRVEIKNRPNGIENLLRIPLNWKTNC